MAFCHLQENFEINMEKLMNTATKVGTSKYGKKKVDTTKKQGSEFAKAAGKRIVQKSAEATGELIGNKTEDKISSLGKSKNKQKETNEEEDIIIPPEKRQQIINDLKFMICLGKHTILISK